MHGVAPNQHLLQGGMPGGGAGMTVPQMFLPQQQHNLQQGKALCQIQEKKVQYSTHTLTHTYMPVCGACRIYEYYPMCVDIFSSIIIIIIIIIVMRGLIMRTYLEKNPFKAPEI
jgi:hypothetical protein